MTGPGPRRRSRRARLTRRLLRVLRSRTHGRPVPLRIVGGIRALSGAPIAPTSKPSSPGRLRDEPLRELLAGVELGTWALGPRSIDEVVATVRRLSAETVLEFGSGSSTVALAWAVREVGGAADRPLVVSIEQDAAQAERTRGLLERAGLASEAVVLHAPLADQTIEGDATMCYAIPPGAAEVLVGRRVDLVLVDGPAGPPGIRFGTLPLARPFVRPGATFLLDDALRDGELAVACRWAALPGVRVDGIRLVEKGILVGAFVRP